MADPAELGRDALIAEIAATTHRTWLRQAARNREVPVEQLGDVPTDDERERAADVVAALERLGLYPRIPRSSRLGFFRHPLVVGAGIAAISAVFASLLIPSITQVSADRPKELELKRGIVRALETSSAQTLARGLALARSDVSAAGGGARDVKLTVYRKLYGAWLADAGAINAELFTYFPTSYANGEWKHFETAVRKYLRLAGIIEPKVRTDAAGYLDPYLAPQPSSDAEYRRIYKSIPWKKLETGTHDPQSSIESILNLLRVKTDVVVADVAQAEARGFKHSIWSLG